MTPQQIPGVPLKASEQSPPSQHPPQPVAVTLDVALLGGAATRAAIGGVDDLAAVPEVLPVVFFILSRELFLSEEATSEAAVSAVGLGGSSARGLGVGAAVDVTATPRRI